jgi:hypothetical protein
MNLLFPVSVTVSTVVGAWLVEAALAAEAPGAAAGLSFVAMLMALAILEHWFLVLPLPTAKLWHWSLASRDTVPPPASANDERSYDLDHAATTIAGLKPEELHWPRVPAARTFTNGRPDEVPADAKTVVLATQDLARTWRRA